MEVEDSQKDMRAGLRTPEERRDSLVVCETPVHVVPKRSPSPEDSLPHYSTLFGRENGTTWHMATKRTKLTSYQY